MHFARGTVVGGDFVVEAKHAEGGMGIVYRVTQQSTQLQRALKVMHPALGSGTELARRFQLEVLIGGRVDSLHVVQFVAAGYDPHLHIAYAVMEWVHGRELEAVVESAGRLSVYQTTALFEQIAHGVGAAHREGIVHRDLKPGNILVGPSRSASSPVLLKVLDFGIAKLMESDRTSTRGMGTPLWMAPEQSGVRTRVGPQADVWALGLIVYFCLTGKVYWRCAHDETASNTAILREMLIDELELPSRRAESMGTRFPSWLDAWWLRCVARDPAQRFDGAASAFGNYVAAQAAAPGEAAGTPAQLAALVVLPAQVENTQSMQVTATVLASDEVASPKQNAEVLAPPETQTTDVPIVAEVVLPNGDAPSTPGTGVAPSSFALSPNSNTRWWFLGGGLVASAAIAAMVVVTDTKSGNPAFRADAGADVAISSLEVTEYCLETVEKGESVACLEPLSQAPVGANRYTALLRRNGQLVRKKTFDASLQASDANSNETVLSDYRYEGGRIVEETSRNQLGKVVEIKRRSFEETDSISTVEDALGRTFVYGYASYSVAYAAGRIAGRPLKTVFRDSLGRTASNEVGQFGMVEELDTRCLVTSQFSLGPHHNVLDCEGCEAKNTIGRMLTNSGQVTEDAYFDGNGTPTRGELGCFRIRSTHDKRRALVRWQCMSAAGENMNATNGVAVQTNTFDTEGRNVSSLANDSTGQKIPAQSWLLEYAGARGKLTRRTSDTSRVDFTYDAAGRMLTRRKTIIEAGKAIASSACSNDNVRFSYTTDGYSQIVTTADGKDCNPAKVPAEVRKTFDAGGLLVAESYWQMGGEPSGTSQTKGAQSMSWEYDQHRRVVRRESFNPTRTQSSRELYTFDDGERRMTVRTEFMGAALVTSNGCVEESIQVSDEGRVLDYTCKDATGKPHIRVGAYTALFRNSEPVVVGSHIAHF
jgi:eukaryotic-like serine/threonine-protein kinase